MPVLSDARPDDPLHVRTARLENGLTVLLSRNPEQPRVYCRVVARVGAAQEPRDATGLAHYLEHMLANKGSRRLGTLDHAAEAPTLARIEELYEQLRAGDGAEAARLFDAISVASAEAAPLAIPNELKQLHGRLGSRDLNAFTSHDQTSFVVDVPAARLAAWAELEADRFAGPVFRSFQTEVETICEEKKRSLDDPGKQTHRALMAALWEGHPYAEPVLGRSEHLERPSIAAMRAFFQRWYVPENMAVVLAGDLDPAEALRAVEDSFGSLRSAPPGRDDPPLPPAIRGEQRIHLVHRAQPELRIGWRTVPAGHGDEAALSLLEEVLHNDGTGLLDGLVHQQRVRSAGCFTGARLQGGTFCLWGRPRAGQDLDELEEILLAQIDRIRKGEFDREALRGIVRNVAVDELASRERNKARVSRMAEAWLRGEDPQDTDRSLRTLRSLTADHVQAVAQRYLGEDRVVLHRTEGEPRLRGPSTPALPPLPAGARGHSALFQAIVGAPVPDEPPEPLEPDEDYVIHTVAGLRVVHAANPHNDLVRVGLRWHQGWEAIRGLDIATRLAEKGGLPGASRAEVEQRLFELATTVDLRPGRWTTDLSLAGPRETVGDALVLAVRRLREPCISEAEAQHEIDDLLLRRTQSRASRDHRVRVLAAYASRGDDSVYLHRLQEPALRSLANEGPAPRLSRVEAGAVVACVTGPMEFLELSALLGVDRAEPAPAPPMDFVRPGRDRILLLHHQGEQAHVTVHSPQGGYTPVDYAPRRLWAEAMGGPAGLVFQEVREKRGMAYSAHAGMSTGWRKGDANLAWMQAGTEAGKAADVVGLLLDLLRGFPADGARLRRVRQSTHARRCSDRISFRSVPVTVEDWRGKGIDRDPVQAHLRALLACEDAEVRAFAATVGQRPVTVSIVGDTRRMDRAALAAIAPVTELTLDDIELI